MPHVTTAKSLAFSLDPRASSQIAWLTHAASVATGAAVRKSAVLRFALALLTEQLSGHAEAGNLQGLRAAVARLPEFAVCAPAGNTHAMDGTGRTMPWKTAQR